MPFVTYAPFESAKKLVDAVNGSKTVADHEHNQAILQGYKMRCDELGQMWPGCELDLSLPDDGRPVCCGEYLDWEPSE